MGLQKKIDDAIEKVTFETIYSESIERVNRGCEWLDQNQEGWLDKIDLGKFNIKDCSWCVLGQLNGDYYEYLEDNEYSDEWACYLGFGADDSLKQEGYLDVVNEVWKSKIQQLRTAQ